MAIQLIINKKLGLAGESAFKVRSFIEGAQLFEEAVFNRIRQNYRT
jgi:hypothetical protein